jgi:hypothetical protein
MTSTRRHLVVWTLVLAAIANECWMAEARGQELLSDDLRVRTNHAGIRTLIDRATVQSPTFRSLIETINASDGIVYVVAADCGHGVRACLSDVRIAGSRRILFVRVDVRKADRNLMTSIGHELRHATEVLGDRSVTNNVTLYFFYLREGHTGSAGSFETKAAILAGEAIGAEISAYHRRAPGN